MTEDFNDAQAAQAMLFQAVKDKDIGLLAHALAQPGVDINLPQKGPVEDNPAPAWLEAVRSSLRAITKHGDDPEHEKRGQVFAILDMLIDHPDLALDTTTQDMYGRTYTDMAVAEAAFAFESQVRTSSRAKVPQKLTGEQIMQTINLAADVVIASIYDSASSQRPYQIDYKAISFHQYNFGLAIREMAKEPESAETLSGDPDHSFNAGAIAQKRLDSQFRTIRAIHATVQERLLDPQTMKGINLSDEHPAIVEKWMKISIPDTIPLRESSRTIQAIVEMEKSLDAYYTYQNKAMKNCLRGTEFKAEDSAVVRKFLNGEESGAEKQYVENLFFDRFPDDIDTEEWLARDDLEQYRALKEKIGECRQAIRTEAAVDRMMHDSGSPELGLEDGPV